LVKHRVGCLLLLVSSVCVGQLSGYLEASASYNTNERGENWIEGGSRTLGRARALSSELRLGFDQASSEGLWRVHTSVLARSDGGRGRAAGLLEAYLDVGQLSLDGFRVRIGQHFAGTSRENIEAFWQSPYTLSLSAINSWIGEEFRPIGIEASKRWNLDSGAAFDLALSSYIGNDTGPAMLAWRGFALHHRISVYGETLPILPLRSLAPEGSFSAQRSEGSQPFGPDLDERLGYALRMRFAANESLRFSAFLTNNRGDQALHDGDEYAWRSRFWVAGFDWAPSEQWNVLGEVMHGDTLMGFPPGPNVRFNFDAAYLLLSRSFEDWTLSARLDLFHISERDRSVGELNTQDGKAMTLALLRNVGDWRFGIEAMHAEIDRPGNALVALPITQGGSQLQVVVRRYFGD
jgi:hypothetical protein